MTKQQFFDRDPSCYFFDNPKAIVEYCKEYCKEEVNHILRVADEVCKRYFIFDLKWDMERTYKPVVFEREIDWNYMPDQDPEFIWQFNRHRFFICLGQAYQITKDEKYAKSFTQLILEWIENVPLIEENKFGPWRTLETGLRAEYWNKAIRYFIDSPYLTDEIVSKFYSSMIQHAQHIIANHSPYRYISNWGVLENHGLFELAMMLPQSDQTKQYASIAIKNLEIEARMQIMKDGVQWEQSPMYHNEVLHCYFDVILLARRNNIALPEVILSQVKAMCYANIAWVKPNRHQVMMGDSDDTNIQDLFSVGAYLFEDNILKYFGFKQLDFESIWDLGIQALKEYEKLQPQIPSQCSMELKHSGNYYMRSDWSEQGNFLHFHCGTLGAGHGHSDQLHIDLVMQGEDVMVDAGRFTYVTGKERFAFKDPTAHNTITVDDTFFTICKDSWECLKLSQPVKQHMVQTEQYDFVQGGHLGYLQDEKDVFVNRKIIFIKPNIYILVDEMYSSSCHSYEQYFHFNEAGTVICKEKQVTYLGQKGNTTMYFLTEAIEIKKIKSRISRHYNKAQENQAIQTKIKGTGFQSIITVICGTSLQEEMSAIVEKVPVRSVLKKIEYPTSMAEAIKIQVKNKTYIVIVCHQEVNSPTDLVEAEGCMGYGSVIVFDREKDNLVGEVLCY